MSLTGMTQRLGLWASVLERDAPVPKRSASSPSCSQDPAPHQGCGLCPAVTVPSREVCGQVGRAVQMDFKPLSSIFFLIELRGKLQPSPWKANLLRKPWKAVSGYVPFLITPRLKVTWPQGVASTLRTTHAGLLELSLGDVKCHPCPRDGWSQYCRGQSVPCRSNWASL